MNIFSDWHHQGLWDSLVMLFEKRLEWNLFRPIGMEWFDQGYWEIARPYNQSRSTATQYLGFRAKEPDKNGIYHVDGNKGITLDKFKETKFDILIASIPQHIDPYKKLIKDYQPQAKLIVQMGNMFNEITNNLHDISNLLASTIEFKVPTTCNAVFYHQEFPLDVFKPTGIKAEKKITSFIINLQNTGHGNMFYTMKVMLPEYDFKSYGGSCDDGVIGTIQEISNIMNSSYFGFHAKYGGDGFGHILYNWMACGKPVVTCYRDYEDKLGAEMLTDMETCIDLNKHSIENACEIIRNLVPEKYDFMCQQCLNRFKEKVNFDSEEIKIRKFLEKLK